MSTKDFTKNIIIRFLCAILLLMVQVDVFLPEVEPVHFSSSVEWVQNDNDQVVFQQTMDDYYRNTTRCVMRLDLQALASIVLLPDLYSVPQTTVNPFVASDEYAELRNPLTAYCILRI